MRFWRRDGTVSRTDPVPAWFFHADFYRRSDATLTGVDESALIHHYRHSGRASGASPHPLFDPRHYVEQVPDLSVGDAAAHFIEEGAGVGLSPHPLFDPSYYRDRAGSTENPLRDYLSVGWHRGLDPHPLFSVDYYLANAPDVAEAGIEPLTHYLMFGRTEQRVHHPMFEPDYYARRVGVEIDDALRHYLASDGTVDPTPLFSGAWYSRVAPEAAATDELPIVHWLRVGAPLGVPPTSHGLSTEVADLLSAGRILEAALRMRSQAPEVSGFPPRRGLSFSISSGATDGIDGVVVGGVPGVIDEDGRLVGPDVPPGRLILSGDEFSGTVRPGGGLVVGTETPGSTLVDHQIPVASLGAAAPEWFLRVVPAVWRACKSAAPSQVVMTVPPPPTVRRLLIGTLGLEGLRFLATGEIRRVTNLHVTGGDRNALLAMRAHLTTKFGGSHDGAVLTLLQEDESLDDDARARLVAATVERGGRVLTTESSLDEVLSTIGSASAVYAGAALPLVLLVAGREAEVIGFGDRRPRWLDEFGEWPFDVEFVECSPIGPLLDRVSAT